MANPVTEQMYPSQLEFHFLDYTTNNEDVKRLFVLCHGFGAPGDDLVPVAQQVIESLEEMKFSQSVRVVVPVAPLKLDEFPGYDSRAWWMLNMQALEDAIGTGNLAALCNSVPPGLEHARELLMKLLREQMEELGLSLSQVVLGGFSQGAMLSTDVALRLPEKIGGLAILSGTLICQEQWAALATKKTGLKVLQTHGDADPILPIQAAMMLKELLSNAGADVQFGAFHGPHTIPMGVADAIAEMICAIE